MRPRWHAEYAEYVEARLPWLRRIAYLLCQDWHGADDLVQVTATRLFTHWPRAAQMDNVDAYVRTILVRTFLGERRSTWFRRVWLPGSLADRAAVAADQDAVLDVREALAALPPRQRATLVLRYYCDLDVEQAAIALGCSAGTVKSQTSKGWLRCAGCWNRRGATEPVRLSQPGGEHEHARNGIADPAQPARGQRRPAGPVRPAAGH